MKSGLGNGKDSFYLYITNDFYVKNRKKSENTIAFLICFLSK